MLDYFRFRREMKDWRDRYRLVARATFEQAAADLIARIDGEIDALDIRELLLGHADFIGRRVDPEAREIGFAVADRLIADAEARLDEIAGGRLAWSRYALPPPPAPGFLDGVPGAAAIADWLLAIPYVDALALRRRAATQLRRRNAARVTELLLRGSAEHPAMLERLCLLLEETARTARPGR